MKNTQRLVNAGAFLLLIVLGCQSPAPRSTVKVGPTPTKKTTAFRVPTAEIETQGPIDDCLQNASLYSRFDDLESECTLNFVHFYPREEPAWQNPADGQIKVGSFNLFHLGDNLTPMKNLGLVAKIINQWDIVGVQELMPLSNELAKQNRRIFEFISGPDADKIQVHTEKWQVNLPGYLALLKELRKVDSSWSLILQSRAEGEGSSGEMAGFYYRRTTAQLKEWNYCPAERSLPLASSAPGRNYGCLLQIPPAQRKLMSRSAFAAYFQSGNFDFIALTAHVRFRPAGPKDLIEQREELCARHSAPANCKPSRDSIGRFYEVMAVADQFNELQKVDRDIIYMGDYNLESDARMAPYWAAALSKAAGFQIFQTGPSTVAVKKKTLLSNYDHFVLNPKITQNCRLSSISTFDFTKTGLRSEIYLEIEKALQREEIETLKQQKIEEFLSQVSYQPTKTTFALRPPLDKNRKTYEDRLTAAIKRMKVNSHAALMELISDHVPVEMQCRIDGKLSR